MAGEAKMSLNQVLDGADLRPDAVRGLRAKEAPSVSPELNVYQRLGLVQAKCDAIIPDKEHTGFHFNYITVQAISNHLRKFCVEAGVKVTASFDPKHPGWVRVDAINLDNPEERDLAWYPEVPEDKGHAYSTKYALIRYFLVGDGEEGDEKEMADKSSAASGARIQAAKAPLGLCPWCSKPVKRNEGTKNGSAYSFLGCAGFPACKWTERIGAPVPVVDSFAADLNAPHDKLKAEEEAEQMPWLGATQ